jgi:hypothetical protein
MGGQVSPDGLYYWDGGQWKTAVSPDGGWRWDGSAWRPVSARSRAPRLTWIVAAVVVASVVVGSVGFYLAFNFVSAESRHLLNGAGITVTCGSPQSQPGATVTQGDTVCGGRLGDSLFGVDCTELSGVPSNVNVYDEAKGADWVTVEVTADSTGCSLVAAGNHIRSFDTAKLLNASSVAIADFVPDRTLGSVGIQVACTKAASCVDFSIYQSGAFSLDEGKPNDGYDNINAGFGGLFKPLIKIGQPNRLIVRVYGHEVTVFLNGTLVTRGTTKRQVNSGYVTFGIDNRDESRAETVHLQRLLVFAAV